MNQLPLARRLEALEMRRAGRSCRAIARELGHSAMTIRKIVRDEDAIRETKRMMEITEAKKQFWRAP